MILLYQQISTVLHPQPVCCALDLILLHKHWMSYRVERIYPMSNKVGILSFESMLFPISVSYKALNFLGSNRRQIFTFNNFGLETKSVTRTCLPMVLQVTCSRMKSLWWAPKLKVRSLCITKIRKLPEKSKHPTLCLIKCPYSANPEPEPVPFHTA